MSSKTPSQESLYENSDSDQQVSSITQNPDQISSLDTHPENQEQETKPVHSLIISRKKASAFVIKNLMPAAPHIQSQEAGTGISRNPQQARIGTVMKPRPWWKKNLRKEKEDRLLMPPPRQKSPKVEKPAVIQQEFKFHSQEETKILKPPEFDQPGEESRFLFPLSESELEDDFVILKFLSTYVSNGGNLAPRFASVVVDFINGIVAENCRIQDSHFWKKVVALHKKFLCLVEQNGGEDFRKADFSTARAYEMAQLCKIVWMDRQESKRSGSCVDLKSDSKLNGDLRSDEMKSADDTVSEEVEGMSLGDAGLLVDPGDELADVVVNVDCGNAAGLVVNVDHGNGTDPGMNVDQGTDARADPGVTMDQTNGADPAGASADQRKDSEMVVDRKAVGLCNTDTIQEPNARNGTDPPPSSSRCFEESKICKEIK